MILFKSVTNLVKYEKLKMQNHFYEMLTATISHDMRTPLNAMIGLLANLDKFIEDGIGKKFLKIILHSSRFMMFLVSDILDLYQIKNGKFRKNEEYVDLN